MKFLVITACDEGFAEIQALTSPTIQAYCDLHGYTCWVERFTETERPVSWYKLKLMLRGFDAGFDFVLWIDTDAIVVDKDYRLESIVEDGKDFYFSCNWAAMNSGVFMMRNTQENKDFLNLVWDQTQLLYDQWWENRAIVHLLETGKYPIPKIKEIPAIIFNSEEYYSGCFVYHTMQVSKFERIKRFRKILERKK